MDDLRLPLRCVVEGGTMILHAYRLGWMNAWSSRALNSCSDRIAGVIITPSPAAP